MKILGWKPLNYLGPEMFHQWQDASFADEHRRKEREKRREARRNRRLVKLDFQPTSEAEPLQTPGEGAWSAQDEAPEPPSQDTAQASVPSTPQSSQSRKGQGLNILNRFNMKRSTIDRGADKIGTASYHDLRLPDKTIESVPSFASLPAISPHVSIGMPDEGQYQGGGETGGGETGGNGDDRLFW